MIRSAWLVVVLLVGVVSSMACTPKCDVSNCSGCCDASGSCQRGDIADSCGAGGVQCNFCGSNQTCSASQCVDSMPSTGGGSGTTGGGSGTTGCLDANFTGAVVAVGGYEPIMGNVLPYDYVTLKRASATASRFDFLDVELVRPATVSIPFVWPLDATPFSSCLACVLLREACDAQAANCAHTYLGTDGNVGFSAASGSPMVGRFAGSGTQLGAVEWNTTTDTRVTGGTCATVTFDFVYQWP